MKTIGIAFLAICVVALTSACSSPRCEPVTKSFPDKRPGGKPKPNPFRIINWSSDGLHVSIAGTLGKFIDLHKITLSPATATSGDGETLSCGWGITGDSKYGPVVTATVNPANARGTITMQAAIHYWRDSFILTANFEQNESGGWKTVAANIEPR